MATRDAAGARRYVMSAVARYREHLDRSLGIFEETGVELGRSHILLSLAELELNGNDPGGARKQLERARELSERNHEIATLAKGHELIARAAEATGDRGTADSEFRLAISIFERAKLTEALIGCLDPAISSAMTPRISWQLSSQSTSDHQERPASTTRPSETEPPHTSAR